MAYDDAARLAERLDALALDYQEIDGCGDVAPDLHEAAATIRTLISQVAVVPRQKSWPYSAFLPTFALIIIVVVVKWWLGHHLS